MPANLRQLTSLRFFAAAWVVAYHYWPQLGTVRPELVARGNLGVELFFVLSGFILSHVYLDAAGAGRLNYRAFLWARLSRIYPVHLATLGVIGLLGLVATFAGVKPEHDVLVWPALAQNLMLVHAWGTVRVAGWNHPSWSISAEWFVYLAFPLFAAAAWRLRSRPLLAGAAALGLIAALYPAFERLAGFPLTEATTKWGALRIVPCFALGCAVNLIFRRLPLERGAAKIACWVGLVAFASAVLLRLPGAVFVVIFGGVILALAGLAASGSGRLASQPLVYLGEVSFALYMVCIPWQIVFSKLIERGFGGDADHLPLALWLLQSVGAVGAAALAHHLVETPARLWMRRHDPSGRRPLPPHALIGAEA